MHVVSASEPGQCIYETYLPTRQVYQRASRRTSSTISDVCQVCTRLLGPTMKFDVSCGSPGVLILES